MGIFDGLKDMSFFSGAPKGVLGIDIGSSSIKVVELEKRGNVPYLLKYGTLALGPYKKANIGETAQLSTDNLVGAIKTLFEAVGIVSKKGGFSIPLRLSLVVTIEIPETQKENLDTVVSFEARKYIPVVPNEVNMAWSILSGGEKGSLSKRINAHEAIPKMKILVAAIHNSTIANYQDIALKAGIHPSLLEIETFSAMRSIFDDEKGTFALLDIGADASKVVIVDYGSVALSHSIGKGSLAFTRAISGTLGISLKEAEVLKRKVGMTGAYNNVLLEDIIKPEVEYILHEADQVVRSFEKSHSKNVSKILLIGGGVLLKGLLGSAKTIFGKETSLGNPFTHITLPTQALAPILKDSGPEYAVSVGLAQRALTEL